MTKPAFLFDGRKILDHEKLIKYYNIEEILYLILYIICRIGFHVETIGKKLCQENIQSAWDKN